MLMSLKPRKITVYYDGACSRCVKDRKTYEKLASKKMFFSSAKAVDELGYAPRPAAEAIADAVNWYRANGYF